MCGQWFGSAHDSRFRDQNKVELNDRALANGMSKWCPGLANLHPFLGHLNGSGVMVNKWRDRFREPNVHDSGLGRLRGGRCRAGGVSEHKQVFCVV